MEQKKQTLDKLTEDFHRYLRSIRRSEHTIKLYLAAWKKLKAYMASRKLKIYTVKIGEAFLVSELGKYKYENLTTSKQNFVSKIEALVDFQNTARVQEIINLTASSVRLTKPFTIKLLGKGNKARIVPLMDEEVVHLKSYMERNGLLQPQANLYPLFYNSRKEKLTRAGVHHILNHYASMAREKDQKLIPEKISPHSLRHSKAMHLLQAGVNLVYIRDILGHESVQTTEVYARVDSKQKREAIEKAYADVVKREVPAWTNNDNLLEWLKSFR